MKEWLPITGRNRVALAFAFIGLLCAVGWNFLPWYEWTLNSQEPWSRAGYAGAAIWPLVLSPNSYQPVDFSDFRLYAFLHPLGCLSLLLYSLTVPFAFFLWEMTHQTRHLKHWLGIANMVGAFAVVFYRMGWLFGHSTQSLVAVVIALGMLSTAIALFSFENEMIMRRQRALKDQVS